MFEQSVLADRKQPWTMAASLALQSALVGTVIVVSIITVEKLGPVQLPDPIPPFHIKSVDLVAVARASGGAVSRGPVTQARPFIAPGPKVSELSTSDDAEPSLPSGPGIELGANTAPQGGIPGALPLADSAARPSLPQQPTAVPDRPKPVQTTPARVSQGVLEGKLLDRVMPVYPKLAAQVRIEGVVRLVVMVGRDGSVRSVEVLSGHPMLAPAAVAAVSQWRYRPTTLNGDPVEVVGQVEVNFKLSR